MYGTGTVHSFLIFLKYFFFNQSKKLTTNFFRTGTSTGKKKIRILCSVFSASIYFDLVCYVRYGTYGSLLIQNQPSPIINPGTLYSM